MSTRIIPDQKIQTSWTIQCGLIRLKWRAKFQQWKFESALRGRTACEGGRFTSVEAWRVWESLLNESLNANGMLFEHYFEHSSKWTNLVFQLLNSPSVEKNTHIVDKVPNAFGFAVIISTVESYQERVYFINYSWRLSLASGTCGSFGYEI